MGSGVGLEASIRVVGSGSVIFVGIGAYSVLAGVVRRPHAESSGSKVDMPAAIAISRRNWRRLMLFIMPPVYEILADIIEYTIDFREESRQKVTNFARRRSGIEEKSRPDENIIAIMIKIM
jgi:hypothetical protein